MPRYSPTATTLYSPTVTTVPASSRHRSLGLPFLSHAAQDYHDHPQMDPPKVYYNPAWLRASAAGASMAAGLLRLAKRGWLPLAATGVLGMAAGVAYATMIEPARPVLRHVTLRLPTLPAALDGLRIGQISDMHLGLPHTGQNTTWAVEQMRREQPDLLAFTGDFVTVYGSIAEVPGLLRGLHAPLGMYAVSGNHDYWPDLNDVHGALSVAGITLLRNERRLLRWRGGEFWLAGVEDIWRGQPDFCAALGGIPGGDFTVLLCHAPDAADEAARRGVDVQLSGHTHGGHVRLPVLGSPSLPRFGQRYVAGQYAVGAMALYVSQGLGGMPLRFGCHPEATIFTLRRGA
jgi:predicted MPP superfamily phosphohydrolase